MITVNTGVKYQVLTAGGILSDAGAQIRRVMRKAARAAIVSDSNVAPLYGPLVMESLEAAGFEVFPIAIEAGEKSKTIKTVGSLLEYFAASGLTRHDIVVALGGGVVGDLAGFAAAIYLRGVDYIQIPTSLLAQIDSSVGGKTGCDLKAGKNLAGAFHQPRLVLIDPEVLKTLPERYFKDGMAEAIKYGCILNKELFERIVQRPITPEAKFLPEMIETCVRLKAQVVEEDERESGHRMLLNFGHTIGHALEKHYKYKVLSHGEAVGIGMVQICRAAEAAKLTKPGTAGQIADALELYGLPTEDPAPRSEIVKGIGFDKKRAGGDINLVLLREIGNSYVQPAPIGRLDAFLKGEGL